MLSPGDVPIITVAWGRQGRSGARASELIRAHIIDLHEAFEAHVKSVASM
jgi:hypothetical protein